MYNDSCPPSVLLVHICSVFKTSVGCNELGALHEVKASVRWSTTMGPTGAQFCFSKPTSDPPVLILKLSWAAVCWYIFLVLFPTYLDFQVSPACCVPSLPLATYRAPRIYASYNTEQLETGAIVFCLLGWTSSFIWSTVVPER